MDSKRRAELQRKLSMGAVPRPPAGLADRIKSDIPKYLEAHSAPERFSWATTMRIAASILLLVTTALVTLELLQPRQQEAARSASREKLVPAVIRHSHPTTRPDAAAAEPQTELVVDIAQELPVPRRTAVAAPASAPPARAAEEAREVADAAASGNAAATEAVGGVADRTEFTADSVAEPVQVAEAVAPPPPPAAPAPAPVTAEPTAAQARTRTTVAAAPPVMAAPPLAAPAPAPRMEAAENAPSPAPQATTQTAAAPRDLRPANVFGISVDPGAFAQVRGAIESGSRPRAVSIDVEALVNYFAGSRAPQNRPVELEVEASPAPIAAEGDRAILRFTVDTSRLEMTEPGPAPAAAEDARLHIEIDRQAVASFRRIGGSDDMTEESALRHNMSVTGLYELELKPNLRSTQRVATVRLTYVSPRDGRKQSIARVVNGRDLAKSWDRSSRRHRLATLGAIWSETLKGTGGATEVARRAEELATENPADARARELAKAATASSGGAR